MNLIFFAKLIFIFIFTYSTIYYSLPIFRNFLIDNPNYRSLHSYPKARGGGLIFYLISLFFFIKDGNLILLSSIPLVIISFIDDLKSISSKIRYLFQLITCNVILFVNFPNLNFEANLFYSFLLLVFYMIISTGIINFINFMDGIDGLVGGCFCVIILYSALKIDFTFLYILSSLFAFTLLNWSPSKIFMGDVGSTFLGSLLIILFLNASNIDTSISIIGIAFPLLCDALTCVLRRLLSKQNIFTPHSLHLYQRLVKGGFSHQNVSIMYILATLLIALSAYFGNKLFEFISILLVISIGIFLEKKYALSFSND